MRVKTKKLASIVIASILAFSATTGGVGLTASAADNESKDVVLLNSAGMAANTAYTTDAYLMYNWNAESTVLGNNPDMTFKDGSHKVATMSLANSNFLLNMTTEDKNVTPLAKDRYLVMPLINKGTNSVQSNTSKSFKQIVHNFSNATISADIIAGATDVYKSDNYDGIYMGLAYIDFTKSCTYTRTTANPNTTQTAYAADIALINISGQVDVATGTTTNRYSSSKNYDDAKKTISLSVNDIINSTDRKQINGASQSLTAENANAVVFCIKTKTEALVVGGNSMLINNITISPPAEDVSENAVVESNGDNTFKAGAVFESINPSDYANVVFKVGDHHYGNTVENAFGAVINGTANIGIILSDATSSDVSVWFTNKDLTYATTTEE